LQLPLLVLRRHPERSEGPLYLQLQLLSPLSLPLSLFVLVVILSGAKDPRIGRSSCRCCCCRRCLLQLPLFVLRRHPERSEGPLYLQSQLLSQLSLPLSLFVLVVILSAAKDPRIGRCSCRCPFQTSNYQHTRNQGEENKYFSHKPFE
jgi:hypothetical protein